MIVDIKVPEAGESISEGVLLEWHKKDGDPVRVDEPLFELETDKITMTVVSETTGLLSIRVGEGEKVTMGQVVATLDTDKAVALQPEPAPEAPAAVPRREEEATTSKLEELAPSVRRLVREHHIDPAAVTGTGKDGRLTKEDVARALDSGTPTSPTVTAKAAAPVDSPPGDILPRQTRKPMSPLRQRIAEKLVHAQQTAAILTTFNEVDMTGVMNLRKLYKESFEDKYGVRLGLMSFFVKAAVDALKTVPALNVWLDGEDIVQNHFYDIGVAVGTKHGLVVPVIRNADRLSFAGAEAAIADFAERARIRKLNLDEITGGCFTVSNGGIYGSMLSTPILNPPQSGILGMHAIKKRPVVVGDAIEIRPMMFLALSYDHRLVDGSEAVTFLKRIVECIENPERMMLDV